MRTRISKKYEEWERTMREISKKYEDHEWERTMRVVWEEMLKAHRKAGGGDVFPHLIADSAIARLDPEKKKTRQERELLKNQIVKALYGADSKQEIEGSGQA